MTGRGARRRALGGILAGLGVAVMLSGCQSTPGRVIHLPASSSPSPSAPSAEETPAAATPSAAPTSTAPTASPTVPTSSEPPTPAASPTPSAADPTPPTNQITHVVAISIDGLNPAAITRLGRSRTPALHGLLRDGAGTLNARTAREQTRTLPNHTAMLTGRRVDAAAGGHGYTSNADNGSTVARAAGRYVPSVFDVVHDRGGSTALYTAKQKFAVYARTWNREGAPDRVGADDGRAKIDRFVVDLDDARLARRVASDLAARPAEFTFVHLAPPDEQGHTSGFMGAAYLEAVERTDTMIDEIRRAIEASPTLRDHTVVVLTADHGGRGPKHDDATSAANYTIPFLVWGSGVQAGADLYAINRDYRDPGRSRTDYDGVQPIRNGDVANLCTGLLGMPPVRGSEFDRRQDLAVHD